jgi:hypothetical protein
MARTLRPHPALSPTIEDLVLAREFLAGRRLATHLLLQRLVDFLRCRRGLPLLPAHYPYLLPLDPEAPPHLTALITPRAGAVVMACTFVLLRAAGHIVLTVTAHRHYPAYAAIVNARQVRSRRR